MKGAQLTQFIDQHSRNITLQHVNNQENNQGTLTLNRHGQLTTINLQETRRDSAIKRFFKGIGNQDYKNEQQNIKVMRRVAKSPEWRTAITGRLIPLTHAQGFSASVAASRLLSSNALNLLDPKFIPGSIRFSGQMKQGIDNRMQTKLENTKIPMPGGQPLTLLEFIHEKKNTETMQISDPGRSLTTQDKVLDSFTGSIMRDVGKALTSEAVINLWNNPTLANTGPLPGTVLTMAQTLVLAGGWQNEMGGQAPPVNTQSIMANVLDSVVDKFIAFITAARVQGQSDEAIANTLANLLYRSSRESTFLQVELDKLA